MRQAASSLWCHSGAASQRKLLNLLLLLVLLLAFESRSCASIAFEVVFVISSNCERNEKKAQQSWVKHGCNEQVTLPAAAPATSSTTEHLFISYHIT